MMNYPQKFYLSNNLYNYENIETEEKNYTKN